MNVKSLAPKIVLGLALILSAVFVLSWLDSVPGLHADEAYVGLRAHDILGGDRPILGMNGYTGSLHQYFAAFTMKVFGFKVWALRFFGALASVVSVFLYYLCVKRFSDERLASFSALILATMPFFVGFSRIANEVFMLNPVLALAAIYLAVSASDYSPRTRNLFYFYSGISMGIGIWTHIIFLSFVFAFGLVALLRKRLELLTQSPLYFAIVGALIALSPRLYYQLSTSESVKNSFRLSTFLGDFLGGVRSRLHEWPNIFLHVLHGDEIFQRFTGRILFNPPVISGILWIMAVVVLLVWAVKKKDSFSVSLLVFSFSLILATLVMSPGNAERYLLLPLWTTPVFIAFLFWKALPEKAFYGVGGVFIAFQIVLVSVNYFHSFLQTGGENSFFGLGEQTETSNHYINTQELFATLSRSGATQVCSEFFIAAPLMFYRFSSHDGFPDSFNVSWEPSDCLKLAEKPGVYAVVYKLGKRILNLGDLPGFLPIMSDSHFLVLERKVPSIKRGSE